MKKILAIITLVSSVAFSTNSQAGIPVIDSSNLAQQIQQVAAWAQQYTQMANQITQLQQTYTSITGSRNLGSILTNPLLSNVVPSDLLTVYGAINSGGYANISSAAKVIRDAIKIYNCNDRTGQDKTICEALLNTNAQTQANQQNALTLANQRFAQIQSLQSQINLTTDPKAIAELQARLAVENANIANDANRIALMNQIAQSQQVQAEQAASEKSLLMMSNTTPSRASQFHFTSPY